MGTGRTHLKSSTMTKPVVRLPEPIRDRIVSHCQAELPYEACGLLGVRNGSVVETYPARNLDRSSTSYTVDPSDHFAAMVDAEERGFTLGGVYHSHPNGNASMSQTDVAKALEPEWVYLVVGLGSAEPEISLNRVGA